jgi:adenylate cyclase
MDESTMSALSTQGLGGTWPPPRATFAALIAGLERAGAAHIVLDFIFLDHSAAAEQDALLGGLAAATPAVSLARMRTQPPAFWDAAFVKAHPALFAVPRTGDVDSQPDPDGVIRRSPATGSLAATALPAPITPAHEGLLRWHGGLAQLSAHGVPVLSASRFIIAGLPIVSRLADAAPDADPTALARALATEPALTGPGFDAVRGRTVFVGANAPGTFEQKPFPISGLEPGVLLHWTAWANLSSDGFIRPLSPVAALALAALFIATLALAGTRRGIVFPLLVAASLVVVTFAATYAALSFGAFFPPATPGAAAFFAMLGVTVEKFWVERRRRHEVQAMFGSYIDPAIVETLVRDPNAIRLGGERREATVFFCDLAGFTDLSEQVSAEELLELINGYLQETSDCLMEHGAYVDKYIGDAVMAVFGAPKPLANHALAACRAALAAQRILAARNVILARTHGRTLGLRIGVNTGQMIVGNVGSERKKNYTVLGDPVNLASRLEGANKEFGTAILLGETTAALVRDHLVIRPLTALRVKGKLHAVHVAELIGEPADITPAQREFLTVYGEGHALYTTRQFAAAATVLAHAAALSPNDLMTQNLLSEALHFAAEPPPADWQPVLSLKSK